MQYDLEDTRFLNWILEHSYRWLLHVRGHQSFWDPPFYSPATNVAAYTETLIGAAPLYWVWRALGAMPDTAFQLWMLTISSLNFFSAYLLLRRGLGMRSLASAFGGALFAFGSPRLNQLGHQQLLPQFYSVLALYALVRWLAPGGSNGNGHDRSLWLSVFFAMAALQLYAGFYLGWFLLFATAVTAVVALLVSRWREPLLAAARQRPQVAILALALTGLALAPMAIHYGRAATELGFRAWPEVESMIPRWIAWWNLGPYNWVYRSIARARLFDALTMEHEQRIGIGCVTAIACLGGLIAGRDRQWVRLVLITTAVLIFCVSFLPKTGLTPWRIVYAYVPGAKAIRGVARIALLLLVPASIGLSLFLDHLQERGRTWLAASLGLATLLEQGQTTPSYDRNQSRMDISLVAHSIAPGCQAFFYSPVQGQLLPWKYQLDAMWAGMEKGVPTINGYSGNEPRGWQLREANIRSDADERALGEALKSWSSQHQLNRTELCWIRREVSDGPNASAFVLQSVPESMQPGQTSAVSLTFKNTGRTSWSRNRHHLGFDAPQGSSTWGLTRVDLPADVRPGDGITFRFQVRAPALPGAYPFRWQMFEEGVLWFGSPSDTVLISVGPPHSSK
jgi:hypothetical protein